MLIKNHINESGLDDNRTYFHTNAHILKNQLLSANNKLPRLPALEKNVEIGKIKIC